MGHSIGFRHTNWNNRPCDAGICTEEGGAVHVPGTPTSTFGAAQSDSASVMQANVLEWSGFSFYDRVAARHLFPGGSGPAASGYLAGSTPVVTWPPMQDAIGYEIYYSEMTGGCTIVCFGWEPPPTETLTLVGVTAAASVTDYSRTFTLTDWTCGYGGKGYRVKAVFSNDARTFLGSKAYFCN